MEIQCGIIMLNINRICGLPLLFFVLSACTRPYGDVRHSEALPPVWPDYSGVTVPPSIAPLNFSIAEGTECTGIYAAVMDSCGDVALTASGRDHIEFPMRRWHKLLQRSIGSAVSVRVSVRTDDGWTEYARFSVNVSPDSIDYGLTYRMIMAGYQSFGPMGIYERDLSSFRQKTIMDNRMIDDGCVNCHTPSRTDPSFSNLHVRGDHSATLLRRDGETECLNTVTERTGGFFVYPYWHPGNQYIAYSVNKTRLSFYTHTEKKLEVYDQNSDIIVYHPSSHQVLVCDSLMRKDYFETYPAFSPDGRSLYFCISPAGKLPEQMETNMYSLARIGFNPDDGTFSGNVDTLLCADSLHISFCTPRPSFDGRYVMLAGMDFGTFPLWHKEADLWLYDVSDGSLRNISEINSPDAESFHNWSSNSRWAVFSSRREDGLYTRLYLTHIGEDGTFSKPFILPQKNPREYYDRLMFSYNIPDFTSAPVDIDIRNVRRMLLSGERVAVSIR